jgi:subtilisin family serine protease
VSATASQRVLAAPPPSAASAKLASGLGEVAKAEREDGRGAEKARAIGLDVEAGRVRVVVEMRGGHADAVSAVAAAGGDVEASYANLVQALVPPGGLEQLASGTVVGYLRPPQRPIEQAVTGEEIAGSNANVFQAAKWTGAGVKVAIVDTGFTGLAARQAEGDLPAGVTAVDFCGGGFSTAQVHGTAVAEVVHEVAPQAQLYLICIANEVNFGQAKDYAKANGIKIVNASLSFAYTARGDGIGAPGTPDATVADARANGILWIMSAGNYARQHWSGNFNAGSLDPNWHDWVTGDETNGIVVGAGQRACVFLKWDDWPTSSQDFNLYLLNATATAIVAGSANVQNGTQRPTEDLCYTNPGGTSTFQIGITRVSATTAPRFDMIAAFQEPEHVVTAGSIFEPASSPNAMAAGALCWVDGALRPYSSLGPTIDGRTKPDIAGLDGVSTATYGMSPGSPGCSSGFNGTSASAPHVAGLAALGKQQNPSLTPAQLQTWLEARAVDVGAPGKDNSTGAGRAYVYTFTDSPPSAPLHLFVEQLFKKGVTTGCTTLDLPTGARGYCPDQQVTRRDMAVFIVRAKGLTELLPAAATFADVPSTMFGFGHVERLYEQGITTGCAVDPLRYCPLDTITRRDMAVFIIRAKGLTQLFPPTPTFADVPSTMFGFGHVERFYEQGITTGCAINPLRYCPLEFVDRKAMAAFLIRAFGAP